MQLSPNGTRFALYLLHHIARVNIYACFSCSSSIAVNSCNPRERSYQDARQIEWPKANAFMTMTVTLLHRDC